MQGMQNCLAVFFLSFVIYFYSLQNFSIMRLNFPYSIKLISIITIGLSLLLVNTLQAQTHYTLKDADVTVSNGWLRTCSYDFSANNDGTVLTIPKVLNGETITNIAHNAYLNPGVFENKNIVEVHLPSSCQAIGSSAFKDNNIENITFPNSLELIHSYAFSGNKIKTLTVSAGLKSIGWHAFADNEIENLVYASACQLTQIGRYAFSNNPIAQVKLPQVAITGFEGWYTDARVIAPFSDDGSQYISDEKLTHIALAPYTLTADDVSVSNNTITYFQQSDNPKKYVIIPTHINGQTITSIGSSSFADKDLWKIKFPSTLTSIQSFSCRKNDFVELTIPSNVTTIGRNAFTSNNITQLSIPARVSNIGSQAFANNPLESVLFAANAQITNIGEQAFDPMSNSLLDSIILPRINVDNFATWVDSNGKSIKNNQGEFVIKDHSLSYEPAYKYTLKDSDVEVIEGIITSCTSLSGSIIEIPSSLQGQTIVGIANKVFEDKGLVSVSLPPSVKSIGDFAFYNNKLISVDFGKESQLTYVGDHAFMFNSMLGPVDLPSHSEHGFWGWMDSDGLDVEPNNNIYQISNHKRPYSAKFTDTLRCEDVTIKDGIITHCTHLGSARLIIPDSLCGQMITGIGGQDSGGPLESRGIVELQLPPSIESIGKRAFSNNLIKSITLPEKLCEIGASSFSNNLLSEVCIPQNVESIGSSAFTQNQLDTVYFEENSHLKQLESHVFFQNSKLKSFILPILNHDNFFGWLQSRENTIPKLSAEGYTVTQFDRWYTAIIPYILKEEDVSIEDGCIAASNILNVNIIRIPDTIAGQAVKKIGNSAFYNQWIRHVVLPNSLEEIAYQAFAHNTIGEVSIPSQVTTIQEKAFYSCNIVTVNFSKNCHLLAVEKRAFDSNENLKNISLPRHHSSTFKGWVDEDLNAITLAENSCYKVYNYKTTYIARVPYTLTDDDVVVRNNSLIAYNNHNGTELTLPERLDQQEIKSIGRQTFLHKSLLKVQLPSTVSIIKAEAFADNYLSEINLPSALTTIGELAFASNNLKSLNLENQQNLVYLGPMCFFDNKFYTLVLPQNESPDFQGWWKTGTTFNLSRSPYTSQDFNSSYSAMLPYTLSCEDVIIEDHKLIEVFGLAGTQITIPEDLCDQELKTLGALCLYDRGLIDVYLPTSIDSIKPFALANNRSQVIHLPNKPQKQNGKEFLGWYNERNDLLEYNNKSTINGNLTQGLYAAYGNEDDKRATKIYPNPSNGILKVQSSQNFAIKRINIYSQGQLIRRINANYTYNSSDISDLNQGLYLVRIISSDGKEESFKLIIN